MREVIRVVCPSKMVFNVDPDTLEPLAVSTYDALAFSDPVPGSISEAEYYRRLARHPARQGTHRQRGTQMTERRGTLNITKEDMVDGFARGRTLIQEEWAHQQEIDWVDELIAEGIAEATPWEYLEEYQCRRRRITGVKKDA